MVLHLSLSNVDGAWNETTKQGGVGVIIRNDRGRFVAAAAAAAEVDIVSYLLVEATAARMGLLLAMQRGFQNFILECDSLQIVAALRDTSPRLSDVGIIIEDLKVLMASNFGVYSTHFRRQANSVAHRLARFDFISRSDSNWF
ncbi:uncharacterized protein [Pyrus communis]|uniref:uncharacterized protein n=1 Tax=Pyrus communis TaxID=23211 RepID=UPI0035C1ECBA